MLFLGKWEERWTYSTSKGAEAGKFKVSPGKYFASADNTGIKTGEDARFYQVSTPMEKFSNKDKDLVIQLLVKHEQSIDCGGGYVKLFPSTLDPATMHGESPYNIMFGPDICGPGTKKVHVIFNYNDENHLVKKDIRCKDDTLSHVYTLVVKPDNSYKVYIDFEEVEGGSLENDWDFLKPKEILDPEAQKPEDWDDRKMIPDPEDKKPEDWDDIPELIVDEKAVMPEDWDEDMDGEWEPPMIDNPEFKGEWKPKMIDNPAYKGEWKHPMIPNPEYVADDSIYSFEDFGHIGIDIWQVKSGTIFDDIIVGDDFEEIKSLTEASFQELVKVEKELLAKDEEDAKKKAEAEAAAKKAEEEAKQEEEEEEEDMDDDEDEDVDMDHDEL